MLRCIIWSNKWLPIATLHCSWQYMVSRRNGSAESSLSQRVTSMIPETSFSWPHVILIIPLCGTWLHPRIQIHLGIRFLTRGVLGSYSNHHSYCWAVTCAALLDAKDIASKGNREKAHCPLLRCCKVLLHYFTLDCHSRHAPCSWPIGLHVFVKDLGVWWLRHQFS